MKNRGEAIHKAGTKAIKTELNSLLKNIPKDLAVGYNLVLRDIRDEISDFFDQHSADGTRNSKRKVVSITKVKLQEALQPEIGNLAQQWVTQPTVGEELPVDDDSEDEPMQDEDAFMDNDEGQDDDYQYNSDGDAD